MNTGSAAACDVARSLGIQVKCHTDATGHHVDSSSDSKNDNPVNISELSISTIALDSPRVCTDLKRHAYDSIKSSSPISGNVKTGYQVPVFNASKDSN